MNLYKFAIIGNGISNIEKTNIGEIGAKALSEIYLKGFYHLYSDGYADRHAKQYAIDIDFSDSSVGFKKVVGEIREFNREKLLNELI